MATHRPLLFVVLSFGLGILADRYIHLPFLPLAVVATVILFLSLLTVRRRNISGVLILTTFIFLGAISSQNYQHLPKDHIYHIAKYYKKNPVFIEGVIISDVQKRNFFKTTKTTFELEVKRFKTKWGWQNKNGKVLVTIFRDTDVSYGQYLALEEIGRASCRERV